MNKLSIPLSLMGVMILNAININVPIESKNEIVIRAGYKEEVKQEEPVIERKEEETRSIEQEEPKIEENLGYTTRMTSYYPNDSLGTGSITGSGLGPSNFEVNDKGWFTYQGKLVIATATDYLISRFGLADGVHTYRYYNELVLNIDGIDYQAIVLDSCGNCMRTGRIDLFVSGSWAVKDTQIIVKES